MNMDKPTQRGPHQQPRLVRAFSAPSVATPSSSLVACQQQTESKPMVPCIIPTCTHPTMAAVYQERFKCCYCRRWSPFGWLYRCIADTDPLLLDAHDSGDSTAFDQVGRHFEEKMSLGKFGADARSDAHNVISDMSAEQRSSYTPNQLSTLLSQRQNLRDVIAKERSQVNSHAPYSARENYPDDHRPWMPDRKHECKVMACHRCYRLGRQKSWAGLDAVVKGDVLPNIATGYSFSLMGARPVVDAEVVKNIGCRPVPLPRNHPARGGQVVSTSETETAMSGSSTPASSPTSSSNGTASPPYYSETRGSLWCRERRNSVIDRIGALFAVPRIMPDELEDVYAPDFVLDFDYPEHTLACCTPLPAAEPDEERFLAGYELTAESAAGGQDFLAAEIPALDGIALTEEAVEFGIADLVPALFPEWPGY